VTICIVDTSVVLELLNVPGKASQHEAVTAEFEQRLGAREEFLLPIAVLVETGNHVAQLKLQDGGARRRSAELFREFAAKALDGAMPFVPTPFPSRADVAAWLNDFPGYAMRGIGLADRSLVALWEAHRDLQPRRRVYIWSLDQHLAGYDTQVR